MNSNDEIYRSYLCDQILAACDRLHKKLDKYDEFLSSYTTPVISYHEQPSWHVATAVTQPLLPPLQPEPDPPDQSQLYTAAQPPHAPYQPLLPPLQPEPDPDPPYAPPAYANRADHSRDWQHLRPPDATPLYGTDHQFSYQHWYPTAQPYHPPTHTTWQVPAEPLPLHSHVNSSWYPPPPRSPTCWDPSGQHASQGYPTCDQSPPPDGQATPPQCSPSYWCPPRRELPTTVDDVCYMKHPFGEKTWEMVNEIDDPFRCTETATVHAAAALPHADILPPQAAVSLYYSPKEQIGEGDALLEYGHDDVFLKASSLSPLFRHEALECIQVGPDLCPYIIDDAVKAIAICCPQRRQLGILGIQEGDVGVINALTIHCHNLGGFSKEDNLDYRELLSVQDSIRYTEGDVTEGVKVADVSEDAPSVADEEQIASLNKVAERECEDKEMTLDHCQKILEEKRTALHPSAEYLGAVHAVRGSTKNYEDSAFLALPCGPARICLFSDPTREGTCLHKIWSMKASNGVLGVSNGAAFVSTKRRHFAFDPGGSISLELLFATLVVVSGFPP